MKTKIRKRFQPLYGLIIFTLLIGIFFRFYHLDYKVYWHDEVFTSLHSTGYGWKDWKPSLFTGKIVGIEALQKYLHLNPEKGLGDTLRVLAVDDPHHPPFYYIVVRFWRQLLGDSVAVMRSFSVLVSLLIFPAIYWLSWELFASSIVGCIAVALIAISPLYVLYAQEAREYALWTVIILLSNSSLLRAIRLTKNPTDFQREGNLFWILYATITTFSLYTSLFTIFVVIAQGAYTFLLEKFRLTKIVILHGLALLSSFLVFMPWIIVFIANYEQYQRTTSWTKTIKVPTLDILKYWGLNISRIFFDIGWEFENPLTYIIVIICLIFVSYALYFLCQTTSQFSWGFILALMGTQVVLLLGPDLLWGGVRSLSARYLIPFFIGTDLAVAYLLATHLTRSKTITIRIWSVITILIISAGAVSCTINAQADTSWTKVISYSLPKVARIINKTNSPVLVGNDASYNPCNILALSYLLKPEVKLQLLSEEKRYKLPEGFSDIFLLSPSDEFRARLEKEEGVKVEFIFRDVHLWLLKVNF